jgi:uncharacterized membrane protein YozB (DUF420 family)
VSLNDGLALANAVLTTFAIGCMVLGVRAVRRRQVALHRRLMLSALGASAAFLAGFVLRLARFGCTEFHGAGVVRLLFRAVWFSHEPLAVVSVPLVLGAAVLGIRGAHEAHREVAVVALPIWLYASISGVAIYALLYLR